MLTINLLISIILSLAFVHLFKFKLSTSKTNRCQSTYLITSFSPAIHPIYLSMNFIICERKICSVSLSTFNFPFSLSLLWNNCESRERDRDLCRQNSSGYIKKTKPVQHHLMAW